MLLALASRVLLRLVLLVAIVGSSWTVLLQPQRPLSFAMAFAPLTQPLETTVSASCVVCAFVFHSLQQEVPDLLQSEAAQGGVGRDWASLQRLAAAINATVQRLIAEGYAYHADEHRVLLPSDAEGTAFDEAAAEDVEELHRIKAMRDRRRAVGLRTAGASPWVDDALLQFYRSHLERRLRCYAGDGPPHDRKPMTNALHDGDLIRMLAAALDAAATLGGRGAPEFFWARFSCVVELGVCPDVTPGLPGVHPSDIVDSTGESPDVYFRAPNRPPIVGRSEASAPFIEAFLRRLSQSGDPFASPAENPARAPPEQWDGGSTVLHPADEAERLRRLGG